MTHKSKITLPPHLYSVITYLAKHTTANIDATFSNILKFTQNSLVVLIPYLLIYSQQCFVTTLMLCHIAFMGNVLITQYDVNSVVIKHCTE